MIVLLKKMETTMEPLLRTEFQRKLKQDFEYLNEIYFANGIKVG